MTLGICQVACFWLKAQAWSIPDQLQLKERARLGSMDASSDPKLDPSAVLLNELDTLLAQLRSMELEVKRAQAAADDKMARLQEQVAQLESNRLSNEEKIAALSHQREVQERALTERQEAVTAVELALHGKIRTLREELALRERRIEELVRTHADARLEHEELASRLRAQEEELRGAKSRPPASEELLDVKIEELQLQLAERQLLVESHAREISDLRAEAGRLTTRLAQVESQSESQLEFLKHAQIAQPGNRIKMPELEKQGNDMNLDDMNKAPASNLVQELRDEIDRLMREAREKHQILQDRNDELVRVKAEMDRLQERVDRLESATSHAESAFSGETEKMRNEFQAQLALLQSELSQKEWALEERQAEARGREQKLRQEIEFLRQQLAAIKTAGEEQGRDFVFGEPASNQAPDQRFELRDPGGAEAAEPRSSRFASHRRWSSGFGWKRRW
jgi:chromosome segregation ATPase